MQLEILQSIYTEHDAVSAICDHMAERANNQNETKLHRIISYLEVEGYDFPRSAVILAFRKLEDAECGKYVEGRHGWKSRFVWSVKSKLLAGAAQGTESTEELISEEDFEDLQEDNEMIEHTFILRPGLSISIELPADLSRNEAQRLSQFADTLSFQE